jgi:sulfhydrogenase subunit beta (sulfur reductase)
MEPIIPSGDQLVIVRDDLDQLLGAITRRGFRLIGPPARDGAIVYDDIASSADLPAGWTDEQDGGTYRLRRRDDDALFGYAVGPQSWKRYLFPPTSVVWRSGQDRAAAEAEAEAGPPMAFIGVRSCELRDCHSGPGVPGRPARRSGLRGPA